MNTINLVHDVKVLVPLDDNALVFSGKRTPTGPELEISISMGSQGEGAKPIVEALVAGDFIDDPEEVRSEFYDRIVALANALEKWHDATHDGAFRTCIREPCTDALRVDASLPGPDIFELRFGAPTTSS